MNPAHRGPAAYGALSLKGCGGAGSDGYILGTGAATKIPFPYRRWPYQISKVGSLPQKQRQGEERQAMPASWPLLTPPSPTPPHALLPTAQPVSPNIYTRPVVPRTPRGRVLSSFAVHKDGEVQRGPEATQRIWSRPGPEPVCFVPWTIPRTMVSSHLAQDTHAHTHASSQQHCSPCFCVSAF